MTIYAEVVFVSNFFIDAFICVLTSIIVKAKLTKIRIIIASAIGAVASILYPMFSSYGYIIKILVVFLLPAIIIKHHKFKSYIVTFASFVLVTAALGGLALLFSTVFSDKLNYNTITYGIFPILISVSGIIILVLLSMIRRELVSVRRRNILMCDAIISNENIALKCRAFYDSGNRVYTKNGERVVIVNEDIYNMLMPSPIEILKINTPAGLSGMEITDAKLEIYFDDGVNKIYKVKAGKGALCGNDTQIILHSDMLGDYL